MRIALIAVLLVGCGDPRAPFVGSYEGVIKRTWSWGDVDSDDVAITITAPDRSDRLQFSGKCMATAKIIDADTAQFDPVACPASEGTSKAGVKATYQTSYSSGVATLTNKTLVIVQTGTNYGSNYADKTPNQTFNFRDELTVTKK